MKLPTKKFDLNSRDFEFTKSWDLRMKIAEMHDHPSLDFFCREALLEAKAAQDTAWYIAKDLGNTHTRIHKSYNWRYIAFLFLQVFSFFPHFFDVVINTPEI